MKLPYHITPHGCWIWEGSVSKPYLVNSKSRKRIQPARPKITIQGKKLQPVRVLFTQVFNRPPVGPLRALCGTFLCVNPWHYQEEARPPSLPSLDGLEELLFSVESDLLKSLPFDMEKYEGFEDELSLIGKHHPHIQTWIDQ